MKIAAIIEDNGLCPCAPSTTAFKMKNAANTGTNRVSKTPETKLLKVVSILVTQEELVAADCGGRTMPCAANQERNWGRVSKITDHRIHFWKRPWKLMPSCRKAR